MKKDIKALGYTDGFAMEASLYEGLYPGRIISQYRDIYRVICAGGELLAEVSGKFRFAALTPSDYPAVGDFVMLDRLDSKEGNAIIHHVLTRKSAFIRKAAGTAQEDQVVASNIDTVFLCMSLNRDFNLRRLERYLSIGWDSGAIPVIILTKSDLCNEIQQRLNEVETVAMGVDIHVTSSLSTDSCAPILQYIQPARTVAFIGSSGVGKSTLINRLLGEESLKTMGLRKDDKGKHTTTRRELILLDQGGMVIDTPGMRELGLEQADVSKAFADIDDLAASCRFRDCTHTKEPGCAVQRAISEGNLSAARLVSYQKLQKEVKYEGLNSKQIENEKFNEMFKEVGGMKNARKFVKEKKRRR